MAAGGSGKSTGDPIRDALIAQGQEKSATEELRDHLLAQEKELLHARQAEEAAARVAALKWQKPTEDEFNKDWLTPREALAALEPAYYDIDTRKKWVMDRLKGRHITAVARSADTGGRSERLATVDWRLWARRGEWGNQHFWTTGDEAFPEGQLTYRYFDIKFDPEGFSGKPPKALPPADAPDQFAAAALPDQPLPPLAKAEAERFCRALLAAWPDLTQDWAFEKAVLFYPGNKVARDNFRLILRSIRGNVKPGKKPNSDQ